MINEILYNAPDDLDLERFHEVMRLFREHLVKRRQFILENEEIRALDSR